MSAAATAAAVAAKVVSATATATTTTTTSSAIHPVVKRPSLVKTIKHGVGRLTASAPIRKNNGSNINSNAVAPAAMTRLTQVSHKAPTRLVPIGKSSVEQAGAAVCALSTYGAGMLQGDSSELTIRVEEGAKLGVVTQGANRIYTPNLNVTAGNSPHNRECHAQLTATVEKDAILVLAPDPCSLFASSCFTQKQQFHIHPQSSVALIDWFSSGRFMNQEQWQFDKLYTQTSLYWLNEHNEEEEKTIHSHPQVPFLQDATLMDFTVGRERHLRSGGSSSSSSAADAHGVSGYNCFASLLLYGKEIQSIVHRCQEMSDEFAAKYTTIREREHSSPPVDNNQAQAADSQTSVNQLGLAGRVVMGVSQVDLPDKSSPAHVVRLAARTNEDLYRVFHECLLPMSDKFGIQFYKDRIRAHQSEIPQQQKQKVSKTNRVNGNHSKASVEMNISKPFPHLNGSLPKNPANLNTAPSRSYDSAFWSIVMLADSGLPTGSFAHSAGLETAAQLRMIQSESDAENFVQAATRSAMQVSTPFLMAGHRIAVKPDVNIRIASQWNRLHRQCQAVMATNEPACAASLDQGKSLARIASQWLRSESSRISISKDHQDEMFACFNASPPHVAPIIGAIGGMLGLDAMQACRLFAYCVARDMVSAAVRLSLVGPLASVALLHRVQESAEDGITTSVSLMENDISNDPLKAASASAPVIEALHPCHEILQVRLFRS
jgi:urease accessory protein